MTNSSSAVEWNVVLAAVRGCKDYKAGKDGADLESYHWGMDTVLRVLEKVRDGGDSQTRAVVGIGLDEATHAVTRCWPQRWRDDFAEQNRLLVETAADALTPAEYLEGKADDLEDWKRLDRRERLVRRLIGACEDEAREGGAIFAAWRELVNWEADANG